MNKIKLSEAKCTRFSMDVPVLLAKEKSGDDAAEFRMDAYTGETIDRWWGKLVLDLDGMSASQKMPIFLNHMRDKIVGFSLESGVDDVFYVTGKFSKKTESAKEVRELASEGFPWQASIGVEAKAVVSLESGASMEVNGKTVEGPAEVWIRSEVFETSFVPLGADANTSVATFSKFEEAHPEPDNNQQTGGKDMEITLAVLESKAPELLQQIRDAAQKQGLEAGIEQGAEDERLRIQDVRSHLMAGHEELVETLMFDGKTTGPEAAVKVLAAEKAGRDNFRQKLSDDGVKPLPGATPPEGDQTPTDKAKTPEEKWEASADLRKEFDNDKDAYLAYANATVGGLVKVAGKKK